MIFTKGGETNHVWFYDMQADGYTLDDKRNKIAESDLPDIVQRYKNRLNQNTLSETGLAGLKNEQDFANSKTSKMSTPTSGKSSNSENPDSDRRLKYFMVPKKEIVENGYDLNLNTYKEAVYEEVVYENPTLIIGKLEELEKDIQRGLTDLKIFL